MPSLELSQEERIAIEQVVAKTATRKENVRGRAILEIAEGRSVDQVAELLHVTRQTVYNWMRQFLARSDKDPVDRLSTAALGRPKKCREPIEPILETAMNRDPRSLGYESVFWSTSLLMRHLKQRHGIDASRTSVELAIHRLRPLRVNESSLASSHSERE